MLKLNDTQLVILTAAAQRNTRLVLPLPTSLDLDEADEVVVLKGLIRRKLIVARPASRSEPEWQAGSGGGSQTLVITDAGLEAIGVTKEEGDTSPTVGEGPQSRKRRSKAIAPARAPKEAALGSQPASRKPVSGQTKKQSTQVKAATTGGNESQDNWSAKQECANKRPGKVDQILVLLKRPEGASITDLTAATGWQAHSVRAALTGLRKRDIAVASERQDGVTRYRVAAA
jgi:hypothetical protein